MKIRTLSGAYFHFYNAYLFTKSKFDHLLELSRWDYSNKWSNIGLGEEIAILEIKIYTLFGALYENVGRDM